ncbi:hypothetical protein D3C72_1852320 [compost metagenome]
MTASVPVRQMNAMMRLSFNPTQLCSANHHFRWAGVAEIRREVGLDGIEGDFMRAWVTEGSGEKRGLISRSPYSDEKDANTIPT